MKRCSEMTLRIVLLSFLASLAAQLTAVAADANGSTRPPVVPAFERFHDKPVLGGAAGGRLLLGELNCVSCHHADRAAGDLVTRKTAPVLDGVGQRMRVEYLRQFIGDPHGTKPGTTMPDLFDGLPEGERAARIEAIVHFLTMTGNIVERVAERRHFENGQKLFHSVGCTACHEPRVGGALEGTVSVPLPDLAKKYTIDSLATFLKDPLAVRPAGRMPGFPLSDDELRDLTHYLLRDLAGLTVLGRVDLPKIPYRYYEGDWQRLPDFDALEPRVEGTGAAFDVAVARRSNNFALEFAGWLFARHAGEYHFEVRSDDGSRLWVDGREVVDNDGIHAPQTRSGRIRLEAGAHEVRAAVFNSGGGVELDISVAGPGLRQQSLALLVAPSQEVLLEAIAEQQPVDDPDVFHPDPALAARGREFFASLGCASCHQLRENGSLIEPTGRFVARAKPLRDLPPRGGCLDAEPAVGVPGYRLSDTQRDALVRALSPATESRSTGTAADVIARTLAQFNCYACHTRDQIGGVEPARNALFHTTQPEMGDEGRLPPHLDGVGAKLTRGWLRNIFAQGANDRPYMLTRMPRFGEANIGHLQEALESVDTIEPVATPEFHLSEGRVKAQGREMVGDRVFGCVKCHNFAGAQATGVQSIDLTIMTRRLRRDWFHRYMLNPQAYRPGTRMPAAWPQGRTTLRDVLDADTTKQIEAIWLYLSDGRNAGVPYGLAREMIELKPVERPVLYRNFIRGAGTRAIAVGFPEQAHLAFDANEMRLALIWQGAFMDASLHWTGRGAGFQTPLGDLVVALPDGPNFARLESPDAAWPSAAKEHGFKFRGYRLDQSGRPVFLYALGPVQIEDAPTAVAATPHPILRRTLRVSADSSVPDLYFRAAAGENIRQTEDGAWEIDRELRIRLSGGTEPMVVKVGERVELRVGVPCGAEATELVQEFAW